MLTLKTAYRDRTTHIVLSLTKECFDVRLESVGWLLIPGTIVILEDRSEDVPYRTELL